jgi:hypothetical protein
MDSATVSSLVQSFSLAAPLLIAAAFVWAIWRVGSRQIVVRRLWQLVYGKQEIADPQIREFVDDEASLLSFRMLAGVQVSSLEKARELISWTKSNDVQMYRLRLCGELFDPDTRQIKVRELPSSWTQSTRFARLILCWFLAVTSVGMILFNRTLLTINATERYFFAAKTEFGALGSLLPFGPTSLKAADCSRPASANAARSSFTEQEVNILCNLLKNSETTAYIKTALNEQRWTFFWLLAVALVLSWMSFFSWLSGVSARKLLERRLDPSVPGSQLALDFDS